MGTASSKAQGQESGAPKRRGVARTKKNKPVKANPLSGPQTDTENNNNKNIQGSPSIQLKRIIDLVTSKNTNYDAMDLTQTQRLLKKIQRLSFAEKNV